MIKSTCNLASVQGSQQDIQEKIMDMLYFKRLEKLNSEFNRYITVAQFLEKKPKVGKYRREGMFLFLWADK